jgi:predicted ABC-type ATPase
MKRSFTWETTMSGRTAVGWLRDAKNSGYRIKCWFLWVSNVDTTLNRILERVNEGGHNIDVEVSRRRFFKTIQNFLSIYRPLCDMWKLVANDTQAPRLLAVEKNGKLVVRDARAIEKINREAGVTL